MFVRNASQRLYCGSPPKFSRATLPQCDFDASTRAATTALFAYNSKYPPMRGSRHPQISSDIVLDRMNNTAPRIVFPDCTRLGVHEENSFPRYLLQNGYRMVSLAKFQQTALLFQQVDNPRVLIGVYPQQITGQAWMNYRTVTQGKASLRVFEEVFKHAQKEEKLVEVGLAA